MSVGRLSSRKGPEEGVIRVEIEGGNVRKGGRKKFF